MMCNDDAHAVITYIYGI